ncbi:MAG: hypothetical protein RDO_1570 [Flavobacteriales endosymbiont of Rhyzopertha dominica]|nr:MAG: 50S ribosomal protein L9 [Candidatus Shikimatogenerans bostrichidophilus]
MIKVILKKNIYKLGKKYQIILVKYGYAINYLIPNNYAIIATKSEIKNNNEIIKQKKEKLKYKIKIKKYNIKKINKINLIFKINNKKKYISKKDIYKSLKLKNILIKKKNIILKNKIKLIGNYKIKIKISKKIETYINVNVM